MLPLETRGFTVPDDLRGIDACTALGRLETRATRAINAQTVDDLFDEQQ
ncbi:hypothetical protein [Nonomuraea harbinensis]|uniref:FXSXX-COOH protein n=1 Tax=Nonomuraea harbinensis TaxID=1286938 RepID=A0ABW1C011_9ACTN|nr:hypothetical protein [Nonomuraea harbinensis]